jgi:hypothetical protein
VDGVGELLRGELVGVAEAEHVLHERGDHVRRRRGGAREVHRVVPLVRVNDPAGASACPGGPSRPRGSVATPHCSRARGGGGSGWHRGCTRRDARTLNRSPTDARNQEGAREEGDGQEEAAQGPAGRADRRRPDALQKDGGGEPEAGG